MFIIFGCKNSNNDSKTIDTSLSETEPNKLDSFQVNDKQFDGLLEAGLSNGNNVKDIFLGFKFGMTNPQFQNRFASLISKKELFEYGPSEYAYKIKLGDSSSTTYYVLLYPTYNLNKLYKLECLYIPESFATLEDVVMAYKEKYGKNYLHDYKYNFIKDNLLIQIQEAEYKSSPELTKGIKAFLVSYIDSKTLKQVDKEKIDQNRKDSIETLKKQKELLERKQNI